MRISMAAIAMLPLLFGTANAQDCGLKQYESLTMEVSPDRLLLPVVFGTVPKKMILRLDDATNDIADDTAQELDMRLTSLPINVDIKRDGQRVVYIARAPEMQLGQRTLKGMQFLVVHPIHHAPAVVGDLGTHMFENMDLELDIAGGKLNLFSSDHCPGNVVYWTNTGYAQLPLKSSDEMGYIRAQVMLDGKPIMVAFSTLGPSRIGMNAMRRIFNVDETSPDLVVVSQDLLGHRLYRYPFKNLTADALTITNPAILVYDEEPKPECKYAPHFDIPEHDPLHSTDRARLIRCFGGDDAVLGLSVLSRLHLYLSNKEKMLYVTSAGAK